MTSIRIIRTCHPNMKSHPARKQNRVRQLISSTKTQKGTAKIIIFQNHSYDSESGSSRNTVEKQKS